MLAGAAVHSTPLFEQHAAIAESFAIYSRFAMLRGLYWLLNNIASDVPVAIPTDDVLVERVIVRAGERIAFMRRMTAARCR